MQFCIIPVQYKGYLPKRFTVQQFGWSEPKANGTAKLLLYEVVVQEFYLKKPDLIAEKGWIIFD